MYQGSFNFPVTKKDRRGRTHLGGVPWVMVTPTPVLGRYCQLTNGIDNASIRVFVDPAFVADKGTSNLSEGSTIKMTDKNALVSAMGSIDFAESVFNDFEPGTRRPTQIYVTLVIPASLDASSLGGTSFGLALTLSLCGYDAPKDEAGNVIVCATGFVSNVGNPYRGNQSLLNVIIDGIDSVEEKIFGCMNAGIDIIIPRENLDQVMKKAARNQKTGQIDPYNAWVVQLGSMVLQRVEFNGVAALRHTNSRGDIHFAFAPHLVIEAIQVLETYYGCRSRLVSYGGKVQTRAPSGV